MNRNAATPQGNVVPRRWWFIRPSLRQTLLIFVVLSLALHLTLVATGVVPAKIAEIRKAQQEAAARQMVLAQKEKIKKAQIAATQAALKETRKEIQADLKNEFNTIVENQLKPDVADQVWQQILAKLTKDLDTYSQAVGDEHQTDAQVREKMEQVQAQMLDELLKHLKEMTTRELAEKYVARVGEDVAPKVAEYYKQQIDKKIGTALKEEGSKIINEDAAAVKAQRQATAQVLNKAETQANAAQADLIQAQHDLDQQANAAANAKTNAQKHAIETAIRKDQNAIDHAVETILKAEELLNSVAGNEVLPDSVKKSIAGASTHPAATQAVADATESVEQTKQAMAPAKQPGTGAGAKTGASGAPVGTPGNGAVATAGGAGEKNGAAGNGATTNPSAANSGNQTTGNGAVATAGGAGEKNGAAGNGATTHPSAAGSGNKTPGDGAVANAGGAGEKNGTAGNGATTHPSAAGSGNKTPGNGAVANAGGAGEKNGAAGNGATTHPSAADSGNQTPGNGAVANAGGAGAKNSAAGNGATTNPSAAGSGNQTPGNGTTANAGGAGMKDAAPGGVASASGGHAGSLADAAHSAGSAAEAAGRFRDAVRQAKEAEEKDVRDNPDAAVAARLAVKHARDDEIKQQLDKAFADKVAAKALPRLSDKLTETFKQTLQKAGIKDDDAVNEVSGKVREVLAQKVPGEVDAGQTGTASLTKAQRLDEVSDHKPDNGPPGKGDANAAGNGNGKGDGKAAGHGVAGKDGSMAGGDTGAAGDAAGKPGNGGQHHDGKSDVASNGDGKDDGKAGDGKAGSAKADDGKAGDGKAGDGKGDAKLSGHDKAIADKIGNAAKDLADRGMGAIGGDESADAGFAGMAAGKKRGGGEGGDDGDGLVELTSRVGHLAEGAKAGHAQAGGDGAGDGDGAGAGGGGGGGAGAGAGVGDGGGGGGLSHLRRDAFERDLAAREAIRADDVADDQAGYARVTAGIHDRDAKAARGQVVARQSAAGEASLDVAAMEEQAKEQWRPATVVVPPAPKDPKDNLVGVPETKEPYHPNFKNIRFAAIPYRTKPIQIDGDLSKWADVPAMPMYAAGPGVDDKNLKHFPQEVKAQWDNTGFYIAYDVKDADDKITKVKSDDFWQGDGVEIWVDTLNTKEKIRTEVTHQFWAWVDGAAGNPNQLGGEAVEYGKHHDYIPFGKEMIQVGSKKTPLGWTMEVHIPAERFRKLDLEPGRIIGMNFSICTGTGLYYYWAGTTEISTSTRPDTWGDVLLAGSDGKLECVDRLASELKQTETSKPLTSLQIGQPLRIRVTDPDMNLSDARKDKISVVVASRHGGQHAVILEETTNISGIFEGAIRTALETGESSPTTLTLYEGEPIDITYTDQCRADGSRDVPIKLSVPTASAVTGLTMK